MLFTGVEGMCYDKGQKHKRERGQVRRMKKWRRMALAACLAAGLLTMGMAAEALAETAGPGGQLVKTEDGRTVRQETEGNALSDGGQAQGEENLSGGGAPAQGEESLPDGDVLKNADLVADADQVLVVRGQGGASIRAAYYRAESGTWSQVFETTGVWGLKGCTEDKREGDKKTPCGVYQFNKAFGILEDPGCVLPYHQVTEADYWVDDPKSAHYNRMVTAGQVEKDWDSAEHLIEVSPYYNYALSLTYNEEAVPGLGSAIFLHCTTDGYPGSSGCICIPEPEMKTVMQSASERTRIVILER